MQISRIRLSDQDFTPSPTTRRAQAGIGVRARSFFGTYKDAGAKVDAMALLGEQSIRYDATLRLLVPD